MTGAVVPAAPALLAVIAVVVTAWHHRPMPSRVLTLAPRSSGLRAASPGSARAGLSRLGRRPGAPAAASRRRLVLSVVGIGTAGLVSPLVGIGLAVVLLVRPAVKQRRGRAHEARAAIRRALPDTIDLLVVAIGAGLTPVLALPRLAGAIPPPCGLAFQEVADRVSRGQRLADALEVLPDLLGPPVRPLVGALIASERYGVALGPTLDVLAHDARRDRRRQAEEAARQLPIRLCFPLVGCTLPAFVLLTIAPLVAGAIGSLHV